MSEMSESWKNAKESDVPKIFSTLHKDGGGHPRACASYEDLAKADPIPHNVQMQRVIDNIESRMERDYPEFGSVRWAWREYKKARAQLVKSMKRWFAAIPCRFWWHAKPVSDLYGQRLKICPRCGAWRE